MQEKEAMIARQFRTVKVHFDAVCLYGNEGIPDKTPFSRLMCEALSCEHPRCLMDIGCGSGIVGLYALLNGSGFVVDSSSKCDFLAGSQE